MRLLVLVLGLALAAPASAATYHVAPNGNDAGPGTAAQPWKRVRESAWRLRPGDTLLIQPGTYVERENVWMDRANSGTSAAPIVIRGADPANPPVLTGMERDCIVIAGDWIEIRNLVCRDVPGTGISIVGGQNVKLVGNRVERTGYTGIGIYAFNGRRPSNVLVDGNVVTLTVGSNASIQARLRSGGWGQGISAFGDRQVVRRNRVQKNWGEGIGVGGRDNLVELNTVSDNFSVQLYLDNASRTTVRRNLVYDSSRLTGDTRFYYSPDGGRTWAPASGLQIGNEGSAGNPDPLQSLLIENNVVIATRVGLFYWGYARGGGVRDSRIRFNSFVAAEQQAMLWGPDAHAGTTISSNVFTNAAGDLAYVPNRSGLTFARNLWSRATPGIPQGLGDVVGDPRLAGPATSRSATAVRLTDASPAIGRGDPAGFPTVDYFAEPRTAPPDIGADELR